MAAFKMIQSGFKSAFEMKTSTTQFTKLIGDSDEARKHVEELKELGSSGPLNFEQFKIASRNLMVFSNGVLKGKDVLKMMADVSVVTGQDIGALSKQFGLFTSQLMAGGDISRSARALRQMGAISQETYATLVQMAKGGGDASKAFQLVADELNRFKGANDEATHSVDAAVGRIGLQWEKFKQEIAETSTPGVERMINAIERLMAALPKLASKFGEIIGKISDSIGAIIEYVGGKFGVKFDAQVENPSTTDLTSIQKELSGRQIGTKKTDTEYVQLDRSVKGSDISRLAQMGGYGYAGAERDKVPNMIRKTNDILEQIRTNTENIGDNELTATYD